MRGLLLLSLFLVVSVLLLNGCGVISQADIATDVLETQPNPMTTSLTTTQPPLTTTTTKTIEAQTTTITGPAVFSVSGLTIEPREIATGELFAISVTVTNIGGSQGSYDVILYIDEINTEDPENVIIISADTITKSAVIAAGESKRVTFDSLLLSTDGIYTAAIGELIDYFEVGC